MTYHCGKYSTFGWAPKSSCDTLTFFYRKCLHFFFVWSPYGQYRICIDLFACPSTHLCFLSECQLWFMTIIFILWTVYTHLMASRSYLCLAERGMPFLWNSERVLSGRNPKHGLRDLDATGWNAVDLSSSCACGVHAGDSLWWAVIQARCDWEKTCIY